MTEPVYDHLYKIVLVGDSGIGKSSILQKYTRDEFSDNYINTIGVDFAVKTIEINGKNIKLQIWDTAGQERFRTITYSYYRGAHGIILVFDLTDINTFYNIAYWLNEINTHAGEKIPILLVGTKSDLISKRMVPPNTINEFIDTKNIQYVETSAKTGDNIDNVFLDMVFQIMDKHQINIQNSDAKKIYVSNKIENKKCQC